MNVPFSSIFKPNEEKSLLSHFPLIELKRLRTEYCRLQLPFTDVTKNIFCRPMKIQSFDDQTSKSTRRQLPAHLGTF